VGVVAIDVDLGEHREGDAVVLFAEGADLGLAALFLSAELVAREAEHHQALVGVAALQLFEALVLRREAAGAGGIDDQERLAAIAVQVDGLAVEGGGIEIVGIHDGSRMVKT